MTVVCMRQIDTGGEHVKRTYLRQTEEMPDNLTSIQVGTAS
jgi:hypothetical protein